jgi:hypothetical protein
MILCFVMSGGTSPCANSGDGTVAPDFAGESQSQFPHATRVALLGSSSTGTNESGCFEGNESQSEVSGAAARQVGPRPFPADSRLDVIAPKAPLVLARKNRILLSFHEPGITALDSEQVQYANDDVSRPDIAEGGRQTVQVESAGGNTEYVEIVPVRLGKVEISLYGKFADGGFVSRKVVVNVVPPQAPPTKLVVGASHNDIPRTLLSVTGAQRQFELQVYAKYDELTTLVTIAPEFVKFKVRADDRASPVVQVDPQTGVVTAIEPGQAVVETSFTRKNYLTCVVVKSSLILNKIYFQDQCQAELNPGERLGPQK